MLRGDLRLYFAENREVIGGDPGIVPSSLRGSVVAIVVALRDRWQVASVAPCRKTVLDGVSRRSWSPVDRRAARTMVRRRGEGFNCRRLGLCSLE